MILMSRLLIPLIIITSFLNDSSAQELRLLDKEYQVSLLEFVWDLSPKDILELGPIADSNKFIKGIIKRTDSGASLMEGEVLDELFILIGEFGEYPEGEIYNAGKYYNILDLNYSEAILEIKYHNKSSPKIKTFKIEE